MYYLSYIRFGFERLLMYPTEIVFYLVERFLAMGFLLLFWTLILPNTDAGISTQELASYFLIIQGISILFLIRSQKFGSLLRRSIKKGTISNYLIRPVNVVLSIFFQTQGERTLESALATIFLVAGIVLNPPTSLLGVSLFIFHLICAGALGFAFNLIEGVLTFYTTEPGGIMNLLSHVSKVLSGFWIPLSLFPDKIRIFAEMTPFPSMLYTPYESLYATEITAVVAKGILISLLWAVGSNAILLLIWRQGLKKYEAVGI